MKKVIAVKEINLFSIQIQDYLTKPEELFKNKTLNISQLVNGFFLLNQIQQDQFLSHLTFLENKPVTVLEFRRNLLKKCACISEFKQAHLFLLFRLFPYFPRAYVKKETEQVLKNLLAYLSKNKISLEEKKIIENLIRLLLSNNGKILNKKIVLPQFLSFYPLLQQLLPEIFPWHNVEISRNKQDLYIHFHPHKKTDESPDNFKEIKKLNNLIINTKDFVQGDIHGAFEKFLDNIYRVKLVNESGNWQAFNKKLIINGDFISGGNFSFELYSYLLKIQKQARLYNSEVIILAGNHEINPLKFDNFSNNYTYCFNFNNAPDLALVKKFNQKFVADVQTKKIRALYWDKSKNILYSHAGLSLELLMAYKKEKQITHDSYENLIEHMNNTFVNEIEVQNSLLFSRKSKKIISENYGGGIFWANFLYRIQKDKNKPVFLNYNPFKHDFYQVIGHTRTFFINNKNKKQKEKELINDDMNKNHMRIKYSKSKNGYARGVIMTDTNMYNKADETAEPSSDLLKYYNAHGLQSLLLIKENQNLDFYELVNLNHHDNQNITWQAKLLVKKS